MIISMLRIKPLQEFADVVQRDNYSTETELHLAVSLNLSLNAWEKAFTNNSLIGSLHVYWLAYESYHFANALLLLSNSQSEELREIHSSMKVLMDFHEPIDTGGLA